MTESRRGARALLLLAALATALAAFQCWYVYLPAPDAARIDFCRQGFFDCYLTLNEYGAERTVGPIPIIPALTGLSLFAFVCALLSGLLPDKRWSSLLDWTRIAVFPAAGLSLVVLLSDWLSLDHVALSSLLLTIATTTGCVVVAFTGVSANRLLHSLAPAAGAALFSGVLAFLAQGAGISLRDLDRLEAERRTEPVQIFWPRFETALPRTPTAALGSESAGGEVLLFVDPRQAASRRVIADALSLCPRFCDRVRMVFYAPGAYGRLLVLAEKKGRVETVLRQLAGPGSVPDPEDAAVRSGLTQKGLAEVAPTAARLEARWRKLGYDTFPTARWRNGIVRKDIDLRALLARASSLP